MTLTPMISGFVDSDLEHYRRVLAEKCLLLRPEEKY
jgi:hypothetical protein